jgi:homoserine kinase
VSTDASAGRSSSAGAASLVHHTVQVPATSANLGAGFDAFGLALDLHLAARTVEHAPDGPRVTSSGLGAELLPTDDANLVWRSFVRACEAFDVEVPDVALEVTNRIPLARGLGSSSAAIVAGIVLARAVTGSRVGERELVTLAAGIEGHPDNVAPAILGGLVAGARGDEGFVVRRINPLPGHVAIAFVPTVQQSTDASRAVLPTELAREDVVDQVARAGHVLVGLTGLWGIDATLVGDRLHEPSRTAALPDGGALLAALRTEGLAAWLSGSGPTLIALVEHGDTLRLDRVRALGAEAGVEVLELELDRLGALACPDGGCAISGVGGCAQCPRERLRW